MNGWARGGGGWGKGGGGDSINKERWGPTEYGENLQRKTPDFAVPAASRRREGGIRDTF